jgi:hypothetical protein
MNAYFLQCFCQNGEIINNYKLIESLFVGSFLCVISASAHINNIKFVSYNFKYPRHDMLFACKQ